MDMHLKRRLSEDERTMMSVVFALSAVLHVLSAAAAEPELRLYCLKLSTWGEKGQMRRCEFGDVIARDGEREHATHA